MRFFRDFFACRKVMSHHIQIYFDIFFLWKSLFWWLLMFYYKNILIFNMSLLKNALKYWIFIGLDTDGWWTIGFLDLEVSDEPTFWIFWEKTRSFELGFFKFFINFLFLKSNEAIRLLKKQANSNTFHQSA